MALEMDRGAVGVGRRCLLLGDQLQDALAVRQVAILDLGETFAAGFSSSSICQWKRSS